MTEPLDDVWASRDFPILRETCRILDHDPHDIVTPERLADALGFNVDDVLRSMNALERAGLADSMGATAGGDILGFMGVSGLAYELVGLWPTPETAVHRMIEALQAIADDTRRSADERSRARKILDSLAGAGRQIGISVATAIITGQVT